MRLLRKMFAILSMALVLVSGVSATSIEVAKFKKSNHSSYVMLNDKIIFVYNGITGISGANRAENDTSAFRKDIINNVCKVPDTRLYLDNGIVLDFIYVSKDKIAVVEIDKCAP